METGKPDEVGEMGEEALGSVSLPRPTTSGWVSVLQTFILCLGFFVPDWTQNSFSKTLGKTREETHGLSVLLALTLYLGISWAIRFFRNHYKPIRLNIVRGKQNIPIGDERFEIWSGTNLFTRAIYLLLSLIFAALCLNFALTRDSFALRLAAIIALLYIVPSFFGSLVALFRPLIVADAQSVVVRGKSIPWEQIHSVEVEHVIDFDGGFLFAKLSFKNSKEQKLGHVSIRHDRLSASKEKDLLEFFARVLGRPITPAAYHNPDWV